ncbi:MAG: TonB family protein [Gemmatimonas sp.]
MSLHLIESTKLPVRSSRKRFGATASVALHGVLVVGAFTVASAAPVVMKEDPTDKVVYVVPEPPKAPPHTAKHSANPSAHATTSAPQLSVPDMPDPITIPIQIPTILPEPNYMIEVTSARDFSRRSAGGGNGTDIGRESGDGLAPGTGVLSDRQVDRQVTILSGYRTPRYPEMLRAAGIEETLNATFVVDTTGRVEAGSLEIPTAQHAQFISAVREALANARFRPAEAQGRRVRQRVVQAFVFSLQRP